MKNKLFNSKLDFDSIIKPIALLLLGIIIFLNPKGIIIISLYAFSIILFLVGIFKILMYYKRPEEKKDILTGLINMLVGIIIAAFTYFAFDTVQVIFRFSIACLLMYTAVMRIVKSFKQPKNIKLVYIITSVLLILLAIILMIFDFHITITGLFIVFYSIIEIVGFIINSKYIEENKKIPEANILKEKEEIEVVEEPKEIENKVE